MNKYLVYRRSEFGRDDELVAVEYGHTFEQVEQQLCDAVRTDASEWPESMGCKIEVRNSGFDQDLKLGGFLVLVHSPAGIQPVGYDVQVGKD